jgi:hypothetical protein
MLKELALRVLVALQGVESKIKDEEGQTLAEYGLIMAVIAVKAFVDEPIAKRVSGVTGKLCSKSLKPRPFK